MTMTQTVTVEDIRRHGERIASAEPVTISQEAYDSKQVGAKITRQGDLYFTKLAAVPHNARPWTLPHGQLVPGTTQGSRHTVDLTQVRLWLLAHPTALEGPVIEAPEGVVIAHPEHGDHVYGFPCVLHVTYQRQYAHELRRVLD